VKTTPTLAQVLVATAFLFCGRLAVAADAAHLVDDVETLYRSHPVIYAEFSETIKVVSTKSEQKKKGRIWISKPNKIRWETLEPEPEILISDGVQFWFYTPPFEKGDRGQVVIRKSKNVQTELLDGILAGDFKKLEKSGNKVTELQDTLEIIPKLGSGGDLKKIRVQIQKDHLIHEINLSYHSGNDTQIILVSVQFPKSVDSALFHFSPDHNTDVLRE